MKQIYLLEQNSDLDNISNSMAAFHSLFNSEALKPLLMAHLFQSSLFVDEAREAFRFPINSQRWQDELYGNSQIAFVKLFFFFFCNIGLATAELL